MVFRIPSRNPPTLEFVFLAIDSTIVNLLRKKALISMVSKAPKPIEKGKAFAKASVSAFLMQKDATKSKFKLLKKKYCFGYGSSSYLTTKCWTLHLELKLVNAKTLENVNKSNKGSVGKPSKGIAKLFTKIQGCSIGREEGNSILL